MRRAAAMQRATDVAGVVIAFLGLFGAAPPTAAGSFPVTILLRQGDLIPGVGLVRHIENVAVNEQGDWIVQASTDADGSTDDVLVRNGVLYLRENQPLAEPPGAALASFDAINLNRAGHSGWNFGLRNEPASADSGLYRDTHLLIQEGALSTAPQFSTGTRYLGFLDAKIDDAGRIAMVATVDDPLIPTVMDRALIVLDLDASGDLLSERVVAKESDHLPGQPTRTITDFGTGPHESAWSDAEQMLFFADLTGNVSTDGVIYLGDRKIAQEGDPSPVPGSRYQFLAGHGMDVNDLGEVAFRALLEGDSGSVEHIIVEGRDLIGVGQVLPQIDPFPLTSVGSPNGPVPIDDDRNVLWFGDWLNPNTSKDTGLFLNDVVVVEEGAVPLPAFSVRTFENGPNAFAMSRRGGFIVFRAVLDDSTEVALLTKVHGPPPVPDGARVPGTELRARRSANGMDIDVTWDAACPGIGTNLFYGDLASVSRFAYTGAACGIGVSGHATFTPPPGNAFFLLASVDASGVEGGHGYDSAGRARPASGRGMCGVFGQIRSATCQ